jgi:anti-sigma-K factor RskA
MANDPHADIRELSGAAAVRALTPNEAARVSEHLRTCASCRAAYAELRTVADLLLRAPEPVAPPPELKTRVLAAVAAEAETRRAADAETRRASAPRPPVSLSPRPRWDWRSLALAASLLMALFFGYSTYQAQTSRNARVVEIASASIRGSVVDGPNGTTLYLENLPQPPSDRAYQVWLIPPGGHPQGVGLSKAGQGGSQSIPLDRGLAGMQTIAVTEEPAGGSPGPTSQILAAAQL